MSNQTIIEMFWHCGVCQKKNRGRDMNCAFCSKPKADEPYEMPEDVDTAPTITDPDLVAKAKAGSNWSCEFCGFDQRKSDNTCAQCGADQTSASKAPTEKPRTRKEPLRPIALDIPSQYESNKTPWWPLIMVVTAVILAIFGVAYALSTTTEHAQVTNTSWTTTIQIEKYKRSNDQGWAPPTNAVDVTSEGTRIHHYNDIFDHYDRVPYQSQDPCGQKCVTLPKSCTTTPKKCTNGKNGFATCTGGEYVCTGGGQSCTTKYCPVTKYRTEPVYRSEPEYRTWYTWAIWDWRYERTVALKGADTHPKWPDLGLCASCSSGEQERGSSKSEVLEVTFISKNGKLRSYKPSTEQEFERFTPGSDWNLRVNNLGTVSEVQ